MFPMRKQMLSECNFDYNETKEIPPATKEE